MTRDGKLTGNKIGVYFGTFAPMHIGHQQQVYKCASLNDSVLLVVSGYVGDRGAKIDLPLEKRYRYLCQAFEDEPDIKVAKLDESDLPPIPNGWNEWLNRLLGLIEKNTENQVFKVTFYVGEEEYVRELKARFPQDKNEYAVELADRQDIQLSATDIRQNPQEHWNEINHVFQGHFSKVVTVMGSAQVGKSTLTRRLARSINAPFSEEYLKSYKNQSKMTEQELGVDDYAKILIGQSDWNAQTIHSSANQGIVFLDTDTITLRSRAKLNLSKEEFTQLEPLFQKVLAKERKDLILLIPPQLEDFSGQELHKEFMNQLTELNLLDRLVLLEESGRTAYLSRYHQAIEAVGKYTGIKIERLK